MNIQTFDPETKKLTSDRWIEYEDDGKTKMRERGVSYDGTEVSESYNRAYYKGEMYREETFKDGQYTISEKNEKGEMITQKYTQEEWDKMHEPDGPQEGFSAGQEGFEAAGGSSERKSLDDQIEENTEDNNLERKPVEEPKPEKTPEKKKPNMISATGMDMTVENTFDPYVNMPAFDPYVNIPQSKTMKDAMGYVEPTEANNLQIDIGDYQAGDDITGEDIKDAMAITDTKYAKLAEAAAGANTPVTETEKEIEAGN